MGQTFRVRGMLSNECFLTYHYPKYSLWGLSFFPKRPRYKYVPMGTKIIPPNPLIHAPVTTLHTHTHRLCLK